MAELTRREAITLRAMIEKAAVSLDDTDALKAVELFPEWSATSQLTVYDGTVVSA